MSKRTFILCLMGVSLFGCAELNDFPMDKSYLQVKQLQILDMDAPERNEGIVGTLDGQYGEQVIKAYRESHYPPKRAREHINIKVD
ncbi:hypothetical protein FM038_012885 [Shewanella eurypsychrophilus]|uniref:Lipoprotein n=2 Tax=Shewanellaceae TaxID=267890 RepID=A0ABX6VF85_9GAMM|nr:hypothetical protein FS418_14470 [Shewanella sp. YLB-09]QPG60467.1 hypothetical protein FM038_012885 [Shewanella eurypsychrophilus]